MITLESPLKHPNLTYSFLCCAILFEKHSNYCCYVHHYKKFQRRYLRQKSKITLSADLIYILPYWYELSLLLFKQVHYTKKSESVKMWIAIYCGKEKIKYEDNRFFARLHRHRASNHILTGIIHSTLQCISSEQKYKVISFWQRYSKCLSISFK